VKTFRVGRLIPSVRTSPKCAEAALLPIKAPTLVIWGHLTHPPDGVKEVRVG
jgi:hypothetical protein